MTAYRLGDLVPQVVPQVVGGCPCVAPGRRDGGTTAAARADQDLNHGQEHDHERQRPEQTGYREVIAPQQDDGTQRADDHP